MNRDLKMPAHRGSIGGFSAIVKTRAPNQSLSKLNKTTFPLPTGVRDGFYLRFKSKLHHPIFMHPKFGSLIFSFLLRHAV